MEVARLAAGASLCSTWRVCALCISGFLSMAWTTVVPGVVGGESRGCWATRGVVVAVGIVRAGEEGEDDEDWEDGKQQGRGRGGEEEARAERMKKSLLAAAAADLLLLLRQRTTADRRRPEERDGNRERGGGVVSAKGPFLLSD